MTREELEVLPKVGTFSVTTHGDNFHKELFEDAGTFLSEKGRMVKSQHPSYHFLQSTSDCGGIRYNMGQGETVLASYLVVVYEDDPSTAHVYES